MLFFVISLLLLLCIMSILLLCMAKYATEYIIYKLNELHFIIIINTTFSLGLRLFSTRYLYDILDYKGVNLLASIVTRIKILKEKITNKQNII